MKQYSKSHEWAEIEGNVAKVGISAYAAGELGDIVFVSLPEIGAEATAGEALCEVESVKAVSEVLSPVSGKIIDVNQELEDAPEKLNEDAENVWIAAVELSEAPSGLMSAEQYAAAEK